MIKELSLGARSEILLKQLGHADANGVYSGDIQCFVQYEI